MKRLLALGVLTLTFLGASSLPALSQTSDDMPDIPGAGIIRRAIEERLASAPNAPSNGANGLQGIVDALANAAANQPQASMPPMVDPQADPQTTDPAVADEPVRRPAPRSRGGDLPSTGVPVAFLGYLAVALMSGGRLLVELTTGRRECAE